MTERQARRPIVMNNSVTRSAGQNCRQVDFLEREGDMSSYASFGLFGANSLLLTKQ